MYEERFLLAGTAAPAVESIVLTNAIGDKIVSDHAEFRVTFTTNVYGVDVSDFVARTSGNVSQPALSVRGSGIEYFVGMTGIGVNRNGTIELDLFDNGSIRDFENRRLRSGDGLTSFSQNTIRHPTPIIPRHPTIADVTDDGRNDLVVPSGTFEGVLMYQATVNGLSLSAKALSNMGGAKANAAKDLNNDGISDVVAVTDSDVRVGLGTGQGNFQTTNSNAYRVNEKATVASDLAIADLNGDGLPDIASTGALSSGHGVVSVLFNNGNGTFRPIQKSVITGQPAPGQQYLTGGTSPVALSVGDLTGDGKPDIIVADKSSRLLSIYANDDFGHGTFTLRQTIALSQIPVDMTLADIDCNGIDDIVLLRQGGVDILSVSATGTIGPASPIKAVNNGQNGSIEVTDMTRDGRPDVLLTVGSSAIYILASTDAGFEANWQIIETGKFAFAFTSGDLNSDGLPDIAVSNSSDSSVSILTNTTRGNAASRVILVEPPARRYDLGTLYSTGVVSNSPTVLGAPGTADLHYTILGQPGLNGIHPAFVTLENGFPIGPAWGANSGSHWVSPRADQNSLNGGSPNAEVGSYIYENLFDLSGYVESTVRLTGKLIADNYVDRILLNGQDTGFRMGEKGFSVPLPFDLTTGFISGINTLTYVVVNTVGAHANPSGLTVNISGTGEASKVGFREANGNLEVHGTAADDVLTVLNSAGTIKIDANGSLIDTGLSATSVATVVISGFDGNDTLALDKSLGPQVVGTLHGNSGDDTLISGIGNDTLDGGTGVDVVSFLQANAGVRVNLALSSVQATIGAGRDRLLRIEGVEGSSFNDVLTGNAGSNVLRGGNGNDTLNGGLGADSINGGGGNDSITIDNLDTSVVGGSGLDRVIVSGTTQTAPVILNLLAGEIETVIATTSAQNNTFDATGASWNVSITGGSGADTIIGGNGNDTLVGGAGNDSLDGRDGNDSITIDNVDTNVKGGAGVDKVTFGGVTQTQGITFYLFPTEVETVNANTSTYANTIDATGASWNVSITGGSGADTIIGGNGNDTLVGGAGNDSLDGRDGNDSITIDNFDTNVKGGAGVDKVTFGGVTQTQGITFYLFPAEVETVNANASTYANTIDATGATWNVSITGGSGADTIIGGEGNDTLNGNAGNDTIIGNGGNDRLFGGSGIDSVSYVTAGSSVSVNLTTKKASGSAGNDTLDAIENVKGSKFDDFITGDANDNTLDGLDGLDVIFGGGGLDIILNA